MKKLSLKQLIAAVMTITLVIFIGASVSVAGETIKVGGKITAVYTEKHEIEVGDVEGHIISFTTSEGTNTSTGESQFLDGGQATNYSLGDMVKGNGPQHGYVKLMMGEDGAVSKWKHNVVTTFAEDGTPSIAFEGKFTYSGGMGPFANISGGGEYRGAFVSKTEYVVEWHGEYSLGE